MNQRLPWRRLLGPADRRLLRGARLGRRAGMGARSALLVVDVQNFVIGPPPGSAHEYPSACGEPAHVALARLRPLVRAARRLGVPVIYTRYELRRDGRDIGVHGRKRDLLRTEGWCLEGSEGAQIATAVEPQPQDIVVVKKKMSAFFGTPLLGLLVDRGIDTVVIAGGPTSHCVRATAVDAASYNFRTVVVADCVFDRVPLSHAVALFDLDGQHADVLASTAVIRHWRAMNRGGETPTA